MNKRFKMKNTEIKGKYEDCIGMSPDTRMEIMPKLRNVEMAIQKQMKRNFLISVK